MNIKSAQLILNIALSLIAMQAGASKNEVRDRDADSDGLSDRDEAMVYHTDSQLADTDTDGLMDGEEVLKFFTNPLASDSDGDGFLDGVEVKNNSDPLDPSNVPNKTVVDLDGDGLSNSLEMRVYLTDPQRIDTDFDGLTDALEINTYFTDALTVDSDGDGAWDGEEVAFGTDPTDAEDFPK